MVETFIRVVSRSDWFGYPDEVYGDITVRSGIDYGKQVSLYQILNDMKIAS